MNSNPSVNFMSLGCARNLVDSEIMAGILQKEGYRLNPEPDSADIIIVNTCGFIDGAKKESIETILEAAEYKKKSCKRLVVCGCLSERYAEDLKKDITEIDLIMGTSAFNKIAEKLRELDQREGKSEALLEVGGQRIKDFELPRINSQPFYTAYLKLAEGCAKNCSFCIIPKLRGKLRSRSMDSLIKEAKSLVQGGVKELNLIAQDLTDYGRDRDDGASLEALLDELVKVEGLQWIRLFYTYPDQLSDEVIKRIKNEEKICKYLDVPIQHINNDILKSMNRHTTGEDITAMLRKLKSEIPDIVIRTSLMVGYPGESAAIFSELEAFVKEGWIDQLGVFTYSHEEDTGSYKKYKDSISQEEKNSRQAKLYKIQNEIIAQRMQTLVGKTFPVIVEGLHPDSELLVKGRYYGQAPDIDNIVIINDGETTVGDIINVTISETAGMDLVGAATPTS